MKHFFYWLRSMLRPQRYPIGYDALLLEGMRRARRVKCYVPHVEEKPIPSLGEMIRDYRKDER